MEEQKNLRNIIPNHGPDFFIELENFEVVLNKFKGTYFEPSEKVNDDWNCSCVIGSDVYVFGTPNDQQKCAFGKAESKGKYLNLKLKYLQKMNCEKKYMNACAVNDRFIYVFGWIEKANKLLGEKYDIKLNRWSSIPSTVIPKAIKNEYIIQAISNRYIYAVFNEPRNKLIYKLDVLDEESGWKITSYEIKDSIMAFAQITPYKQIYWTTKSEFTIEEFQEKSTLVELLNNFNNLV